MLRRDLKPAALCEFEAAGRKANTARAGPGKISVRKFMQGKSKYYFPPYFMRKRDFWFPESGATPTGGQRKKINIPLVSLAL